MNSRPLHIANADRRAPRASMRIASIGGARDAGIDQAVLHVLK